MIAEAGRTLDRELLVVRRTVPTVDDATRREFLAGLAAAGLLTACGARSDEVDAGATTSPGTRSITHALGTIADAVGRSDRVAAVDAEYEAELAALPNGLRQEVVAIVRSDDDGSFRIDSLSTAFPGSVAEDAGVPRSVRSPPRPPSPDLPTPPAVVITTAGGFGSPTSRGGCPVRAAHGHLVGPA